MNKIIKYVSLFLMAFTLFSFNSCNKTVEKSISVIEPETPAIQPGRIIVLVVDVSQSISKQLDDIINGLCDKIVDTRLESNDYCVIVPLGDATNVDKADSFGIKYSSDKEKIKKYLQNMKTWMPTNLNTDIGAAMKKTFQYVNMIEKENDGNMLDPLVLFITDGEIFYSKNSKPENKLRYNSIDAIFNDSTMNPDNTSYDNWWFLGIENEGIPLVHIKSIAQKVNAYPDRYETLNDMSQFGILFDNWLTRIPPVKPKDIGRITFANVKLGDNYLSTDDSKYTVVPNNSDLFTWKMKSEYKVNNVVLNFKNITGTFQKDSTGETETFQLVPETGNIEFTPGSVRETRANVKLPQLSGKGKLKLTIYTELNAECEGQIPEYLFFVEFKSPFVLIMEKVLPVVSIIILIIVLIFLMKFIKSRKPIRIKVEIIGKKAARPRIASLKIKKEAEFGSKAGISLKLEAPGIPPVLGKIIRTGKNEWKIEPKSSEWFAPDQKLDPYVLNTSIKITLKDGSTCLIKFMKVR